MSPSNLDCHQPVHVSMGSGSGSNCNPLPRGDMALLAVRSVIGQALVWEFVLVFPRHPSIRGWTLEERLIHQAISCSNLGVCGKLYLSDFLCHARCNNVRTTDHGIWRILIEWRYIRTESPSPYVIQHERKDESHRDHN